MPILPIMPRENARLTQTLRLPGKDTIRPILDENIDKSKGARIGPKCW